MVGLLNRGEAGLNKDREMYYCEYKKAITLSEPDFNIETSPAWQQSGDTMIASYRSGYIPRLPIKRWEHAGNIFEVQRLAGRDSRVYFLKGLPLSDVIETIRVKEGFVGIHIVLKGSIKHTLGDSHPLVLGTGQYCVAYVARDKLQVVIEKGAVTSTINVLFPVHTVAAILVMYPGLDFFSDSMKAQKACYLSNDGLYMHAGLYDLVSRIIDVSYNAMLDGLYDSTCLLLLQEMFATARGSRLKRGKLKPDWMEGVYAAKLLIDEHLQEHYRLPQLARKVAINERQLKTGFKALFGMGVYAYLKRKRLEAAFAALDDSDHPLKYIARQAGFKSTGAFIKAFKQQYGHTPGKLRKR